MNGILISRMEQGGILARTRTALVLLLSMFYLGGCAASSGYTTRAYPTVPKPGLGDDDYSKWMEYYTDQFASLGDKAEEPGAAYPEAARKAYADAKQQWDTSVASAKLLKDQSKRAANTMWYGIAGVAAGILFLNFVVF